MKNLRKLLTLTLLIGSSRFSLTEIRNENLSTVNCVLGQGNFSLNLTNVGLRSLPDGFIKNEFLTHLILDENQIPAVSSKTFMSVPKLSYLSLANNKLSTLDLNPFSDIENLETLILNGNCKPRITAEYNRPHLVNIKMKLYDSNKFCSLRFDSFLKNLKHLFLEDNNLQKLIFTSGKLPSLTHLYLANNQLKIDEDMIKGLKEFAPVMTHLYLNHSRILEFDLSRIPNLKAIYLDDNEIQSICNDRCNDSFLKLKGARNLERLSIPRNQISKITIDSFNQTTSLAILDLSHNKISELQEGTFAKLQSLRSLYLENNNLVKLNGVETFRSLINLENLYLGYNNISDISARVFENLGNLKILTLNHNKISTIYVGTFSNLISLEKLSLADNQLSKIPKGSIPTSGSLIVLNLDNNEFTSLEDISITNVPHMLSLSLKDNPLTGMTSRWFTAVPPNLNIAIGSSCYSNNQTSPSIQ